MPIRGQRLSLGTCCGGGRGMKGKWGTPGEAHRPGSLEHSLAGVRGRRRHTSISCKLLPAPVAMQNGGLGGRRSCGCILDAFLFFKVSTAPLDNGQGPVFVNNRGMLPHGQTDTQVPQSCSSLGRVKFAPQTAPGPSWGR